MLGGEMSKGMFSYLHDMDISQKNTYCGGRYCFQSMEMLIYRENTIFQKGHQGIPTVDKTYVIALDLLNSIVDIFLNFQQKYN